MATDLHPKNYKENKMFDQHPDNMRMEPTPERVYSACRIIERMSLSRSQLKEAMALGEPGTKNYGEVNAAIKVALDELHLLVNKDDILYLAIDPEILSTPISFRRYVSSIVFKRADSTFVRFSSWYISKNEAIFPLNSWEVKAKTAAQENSGLQGMSENAALGWRFWAAYLGLGYLHGTTLIPNMKIRLQDLLATDFPKAFNYDEPIRSSDFIFWLSGKLPEVKVTTPLPLALSAGMRTLHELGFIYMEARPDTERVPLYYVDGDPINDFSHITVKGDRML